MKSFLLKADVLAGFVLGLAALALYTITLAPDVLAHDSGEWQAAAATLGISHSPGSPGYILLGWLFTLVPIGTAAARVSFVSAVISSIGVAAVYAFMLLLLGRMLPAIVAATTLAVAGLWWSHASVATPYNAIPAIMAVTLALLLLWRQRGDVRTVWAGALVFGFGLTLHPSLIFFLPVLIAGIFVLGPWRELLRPRSLAVTGLLFLLGLSVYAYVPVRSSMDPAVASARVDSLSSFLDYVSAGEARSMGHGVFELPSAGEFRQKLFEVVRQSYYPSFAFLVFGPAIVLFYPGVWKSLRKFGRPLIFVTAAMIAHMFFVFAISGVYTQYYLPLLFYFSIWAGFSVFLMMKMGEANLSAGIIRHVPVIITGIIYFGVLALGIPSTWDLANHRQDDGMRSVVEVVEREAEPQAVLMANWESYGGMLYAQKAEGLLPGVRVYSVPQSGWRELLPQVRAENPGSQILLALTLPNEWQADMTEVAPEIFLTIKGRTYADYTHGEPYPATIRIFELTP